MDRAEKVRREGRAGAGYELERQESGSPAERNVAHAARRAGQTSHSEELAERASAWSARRASPARRPQSASGVLSQRYLTEAPQKYLRRCFGTAGSWTSCSS